MKHLIVIPFYCEAEIDRYCQIAAHLRRMPKQVTPFRFLVAASHRAPSSHRIVEAYSRITDVVEYRCQKDVPGYPQGPTQMFWETFDHIAGLCNGTPGFSLWLESDMVPVKPDWVDRLSSQWKEQPDCLIMGLRVPVLHRQRFLGRPKASKEHINGGACYAHDFSQRISEGARAGDLFDVCAFPYIKKAGSFQDVPAFAFSTVSTLPFDIGDPSRVILHGWKQDKDRFVREATRVARPGNWVRSLNEPVHSAERCCEFAKRRSDGYHCQLHSRTPPTRETRCA